VSETESRASRVQLVKAETHVVKSLPLVVLKAAETRNAGCSEAEATETGHHASTTQACVAESRVERILRLAVAEGLARRAAGCSRNPPFGEQYRLPVPCALESGCVSQSRAMTLRCSRPGQTRSGRARSNPGAGAAISRPEQDSWKRRHAA
jgi:hypothetical protein